MSQLKAGLVVSIGVLLVACSGTGQQGASKESTTSDKAVEVVDAAPSVVTAGMYPTPAKEPNYGPEYGSITFTDTDPGPGIGGVITMGRAVDAEGNRVNENEEGITAYMIHWGLVVAGPGVGDDAGAGDLGGDCRGFRDTGHIVMADATELAPEQALSWTIPEGTAIPDQAVYFVGHSVYGKIHNLGKCTQIPIVNLVE